MPAKRIAKEWNEFAAKVLHPDAPPIQRQEMRRSFYAGAWAFYTLLMGQVSPGEEVSDMDVAMMAELHVEMEQFAEDVARGRA